MTELRYKFTNDVLFKMLFARRPWLLRRLVALALGIPEGSITKFVITNTEIPPEGLGDKFCRLDINMIVNGRRVSLEVQVVDEGDYPERSLYYWARDFSSALQAGDKYSELPSVVIISILDFLLFDCDGYHSEFRPLEVSRGEQLSDKMALHYFEIGKLPEGDGARSELEQLLWLFRAKTEEDLKKLERLEVSAVRQTIKAYREITVSDEFRELARLRERARHNEASALHRARETERKKWQGVVADKDAALAEQAAEIARLKSLLEGKA